LSSLCIIAGTYKKMIYYIKQENAAEPAIILCLDRYDYYV